MAYRQANEGFKKSKISRGDVKRREKKIAELEKDLKMERQKYEDRMMQLSKENEQLKASFRFAFRHLASRQKIYVEAIEISPKYFLFAVADSGTSDVHFELLRYFSSH